MHYLPQSLMALLAVTPVWAVMEQKSQATLYDPFHYIALQAPPLHQDPVCCLRPLEKEPVPELLTFEEWKEKNKQKTTETVNSASHERQAEGEDHSQESAEQDAKLGDQAAPSDKVTFTSRFFNQVPLTDRFNYASEDCSARVHKTHKGAQSTSAILSHKKDKYMLTPCSTKDKFMIVELCDDIRIDTVQLANYEFFSGVFRSIRISVAQTYTSDTDGWVEMGVYDAKNVRSIQSFHPLTELRPFYRYIRIDFLSHYGNEYYCPVSLLRVFGLTQMEEWKWEAWEADWQKRATSAALKSAKEAESVRQETFATPLPMASDMDKNATDASPVITPPTDSTGDGGTSASTAQNVGSTDHPSIPTGPETSIGSANPSVNSTINATPNSIPKPTPTSDPPPSLVQSTPSPNLAPTQDSHSDPPFPSSNHSDQGIQTSIETSTPVGSGSTPVTGDSNDHYSSNTVSSSVPSARLSSTYFPRPASSPYLIAAQAVTQVPSGDSVFRTIANRISALESNTTLYMQYVEVQNRSIKEAIRKLEEDVGRLAGISKSQTTAFQKAVGELAKQRRELEVERLELVSQINYLANEILLEKRLGIAQLVLLLVVLGFMFVSRNPQSEALFVRTTSAFKKFRTRSRVLSLSSDWGVFKRNRSDTGSTVSPIENKRGVNGERYGPNYITDKSTPNSPTKTQAQSTTPVGHSFPRKSRSRSCSSDSASDSRFHDTLPPGPKSPVHNQTPPGISPLARPRLFHRTSSQSAASLSLGPNAVFSPRRLARTAHLHELKPRLEPQFQVRRPVTPLGNVTNHLAKTSPRKLSQNRLRQRRSSKMTPRSSMFRELHPNDEAPDVFYSPVDEINPVTQLHLAHDGHESDGWVDTDVDEVGAPEPVQEIEFPYLTGDIDKDAPLLLGSPPSRHTGKRDPPGTIEPR